MKDEGCCGERTVIDDPREEPDRVIRRMLQELQPGQILRYPELRIAENGLARLNIFEMNPEKGIRPTIQVLDSPGPFKDLLVKGGKIHAGITTPVGSRSATLPLPEVHLQNIGSPDHGVTAAELSRQILESLLASAVTREVVRGVFRYLQRWWVVAVSRYVENELKQELFDKLVSLPFKFHAKSRSGERWSAGK